MSGHGRSLSDHQTQLSLALVDRGITALPKHEHFIYLFNVGVRDLCQKLNEYKGRRLNDVLSVDMFGDIPNYKVKDFHLMPPVGVGRPHFVVPPVWQAGKRVHGKSPRWNSIPRSQLRPLARNEGESDRRWLFGPGYLEQYLQPTIRKWFKDGGYKLEYTLVFHNSVSLPDGSVVHKDHEETITFEQTNPEEVERSADPVGPRYLVTHKYTADLINTRTQELFQREMSDEYEITFWADPSSAPHIEDRA